MKFIKAHTNGNDFIIINNDPLNFSVDQIVKLCNRKTGIGCDQLIFVQKDIDYYKVFFFNSDGSYANMCGNGSCAVVRYIREVLGDSSDDIDLMINEKIYKTSIDGAFVTVFFDKPQVKGDIILTGNKHIVRDIAEIKNIQDIKEQYSDCNIHFIKILSNNKIRVRTFERGAGKTLACGSGAVAVGFFSKLSGKIEIVHDGGSSYIEISDKCVKFTTSPKLVFEGVFYE